MLENGQLSLEKTSQCLFVPKFSNVCEQFPDFLGGIQGVAQYISEDYVEFTKPKKKPKTKLESSGKSNQNAAVASAVEVIEIRDIPPASPQIQTVSAK